MNICLLTPSFLPSVGGMEVVVDKLARNFVARGHECVVIAKSPRPGEGPVPELPYPVVHHARTRSAVWFLGPMRRAVLAEHARRGFDVIHAHMAYPTGYVAWQAGRRAGVPVVPLAVIGTNALQPPGCAVPARKGRVTVLVGKPIPMEGKGLSYKAGLMEEVRAAIEGLMQCRMR